MGTGSRTYGGDRAGESGGGIKILVRPHNIASKTAKIPKGGPKLKPKGGVGTTKGDPDLVPADFRKGVSRETRLGGNRP